MEFYQPSFSSFQPHDRLFGDEDLQRRVGIFLSTQAAAQARQIRVSASAGRVTLRGRVASSVARQFIQACCRRVAGVVDVHSEIRISAARATAPRVSASGAHLLFADSQSVVPQEFAA